MELKESVKQMLVNKNNARYNKELQSRRISYHDWVSNLEAGEEAAFAAGFPEEFVLLANPRGRVAARGREWIAEWFARFPEALILYGDEDVWDGGGERRAPYFKPDWSPDLFRSRLYTGGLAAVRKSWLETCGEDLELRERLAELETLYKPAAEDGKVFAEYREACGCLLGRLVELAGGYERGRGRRTILHIPRIVFHNRSEESREEWMSGSAEEHKGLPGSGGDRSRKLLSVIIPSKDNPDLLEKCIRSVAGQADGLRYETGIRTGIRTGIKTGIQIEIIVVDNGSAPGKRAQIEKRLEAFRQSVTRLVYHYEPMAFNFSKMCNLGAEKALGDLLLFLNDDVELVCHESLQEMAELACRPYVGAVGMKLLYPDGKAPGQIQHAGITNLPMGPVHKLQFCRDEDVYYFGRNRGCHNVLAVTGACLMTEREKFCEAGGFDRELPVAFNDVELCFRLYELGYENVCLCDSFAYHDESYSRGDDESADKLARLWEERRKLYERHPALEGKDPYYSIYLNRVGLDTRIRPLYETEGSHAQRVGGADGISLGSLREKEIAGYRLDACLMIRVESVSVKEGTGNLLLTGWSVVLGDNNACYEKCLILKQELISGTASGERARYFTLPLRGRYRPDLVENMPDQTNVGLCGYLVEFGAGALPAGRYRIGIMARSRVGGTRLINWSNRMLEVLDVEQCRSGG